jgi:predicted AlkP superfamily phosphohydrolase/phosphomutase/tetratricopeptide (TPR) repeat protein
MPALKKLMDSGVHGNIATLDPPFSPMLWTTVATGKTPEKHGILNFTEPDANNGGIRPVLSTSRRSRTLWNIFTHQGLKSNVVSWWPSHPAEPINGVMVSDFYQKADGELGEPWPMRKGTVYPPEMAEELGGLRVHPQELTAAHVLPFIPDAAKIEQEEDKHMTSLLNILGHTASVHAAHTHLLENTEWDFQAVYLDGIDHFCHAFMRFHPPMLPSVPQKYFDLYKGVVAGGYKFHDMMLERTMKLIDDDTIVILMSDHGFYNDHLRLQKMPSFNAAPALEHRPYGMICVAGPGIAKGKRVFGASLMDITPTILTMYGLPVAKDMDGKVLYDIFEERPTPTLIDSWETVEGNFGEHPADMQEDPVEAAAAMQQLIDLGYVDDPGEDKQKAAAQCNADITYNLAMVYKGKRDFVKAVELLEPLHSENESDLRCTLELASLYLKLRNVKSARKMVEILKAHKELKMINLPLLQAKLFHAENKPHLALKYLDKAATASTKSPNLHLERGRIYLVMHRFEQAEKAYRSALERDAESADAFHGIAVSLLRRGDAEPAAESALQAISLLYHFPNAHYILAESLEKCGLFKEAGEAYAVTLRLAPQLIRARKAYANLLRSKLNDEKQALRHEQILTDVYRGKLCIVAGLPNAGVEAATELLVANGIEIWSEGDESFTIPTREQLTETPDFLRSLDGKALVLSASQLKLLPADMQHKVIFVNREMDELLKRWSKSQGQPANTFPAVAAKNFENELDRIEVWQLKEPHVYFFSVDYRDLVAEPAIYKDMLRDFLG